MNISVDNYCEYPNIGYLIHSFSEPLFLKPDGNRTRYPIGWNGYGRYIPGTLKVKYNGIDCNITEEDNGVFYNFSVAPGVNTSYNDYEISYTVRPLDYAFSTGDILGGYEGEEYFLFPNWNNAGGLGNGFWVGKYEASNDGNGIPQSKANETLWTKIDGVTAVNICPAKGSKFHMILNREWSSIALWCDHHNIEIYGNQFGNNINDLDHLGTTLDSCGGGYDSGAGWYLVTGSNVPNEWNHNHLSTGIHNLCGNIYEYIGGLGQINGGIYIQSEDTYSIVDTGIIVTNDGASHEILSLYNETPDILNECIPNVLNSNGYIPNTFNTTTLHSEVFSNTTEAHYICRATCAFNGSNGNTYRSSLWSIAGFKYSESANNQFIGFRLSRSL